MEQQALYREFHLDEPWDSEHNKKLIHGCQFLCGAGEQSGGAIQDCLSRAAGRRHDLSGWEEISIEQITDGNVEHSAGRRSQRRASRHLDEARRL